MRRYASLLKEHNHGSEGTEKQEQMRDSVLFVVMQCEADAANS